MLAPEPVVEISVSYFYTIPKPGMEAVTSLRVENSPYTTMGKCNLSCSHISVIVSVSSPNS